MSEQQAAPGVDQPPASAWGTWLAAALPFAFYLSTTGAGSYWLDGGEFVEACVELDIAHPPGHPLTELYGKAWSLLPLGPLAFRIALGQAVAAALAAALLFRACSWTVRSFSVSSRRVELPIGLLCAWGWALGRGVWFQAVRPEVYALQGLVSLLTLERLAWLRLDDARDVRPLYVATFATALGLTNHHMMALFLMPALICSALRSLRRHGVRVLAGCLALGLLGLSVYAYLPLRAASDPPLNLGDPRTLARMFWVVSAQAYVKSVHNATEPLGERFADLALVTLEHLYGVLVLLALLGSYVARKQTASARVCGLWWWVVAGVFLIKALVGFERNNPDSLAYLMAGIAAVVALAAAGLAAFASLAQRPGAAWMVALWSLPPLLVGAAIIHVRPDVDLSAFEPTDGFDDARVRRVPARSVIVATTPQTVFRHAELLATERLRPDATLLPVPFLNYPGVADAIVRRHPELRELVQTFRSRDRLDPVALARLASVRPVLVELDWHLPPAAYGSLLPQGLLFEYVAPPANAARLLLAADARRETDRSIAADLGPGVAEAETARQWLFVHYFDAVFYAARGATSHANQALDAAQAVFPNEPDLARLRSALAAAPPQTALDIAAFLPAAP